MHQAFASVEAMLDPVALSGVLGRSVATVDLAPLVPKGHSSTDARFEGVEIDGESTPSLVLKTVYRDMDWVAVTTGDSVDREVAIWESGVLDGLPDGTGHAVVAGARFPGGAALLMHNLEDQFQAGIRDSDVITPEWNSGLLRSLASMHATFWGPSVIDRLGGTLCSLQTLLAMLGPTVLPALTRAVPTEATLNWVGWIENRWTTLPELIGTGPAADLLSIATDPSRACRALAVYPRTLLQGDVRPANVAWDGRRATLIDWAKPSAGPPAIDLVYYLFFLEHDALMPPDEAAAEYLGQLKTSLGPTESWAWWNDQLDVCFAAVFAMLAPIAVGYQTESLPAEHPPSAEIGWWVERAERGLRMIARA